MELQHYSGFEMEFILQFRRIRTANGQMMAGLESLYGYNDTCALHTECEHRQKKKCCRWQNMHTKNTLHMAIETLERAYPLPYIYFFIYHVLRTCSSCTSIICIIMSPVWFLIHGSWLMSKWVRVRKQHRLASICRIINQRNPFARLACFEIYGHDWHSKSVKR